MTNTISVATLSELYSALESVKGGETIALEGGDYGKLFLGASSGFDITFPSNVTITSADPGNPASFSELDVRNASNLTFDGVTFDYTFKAGDNIYDRPFSITGSEDITIRNSTFDGDLAQGISDADDGYGYAIGLSLRNSSGLTVEHNEFFEFHRGASISDSDEIVVRGNDLHSLRMDGLNFAEVTNVMIENNYLHDFKGSPNSDDHSDMIQFWTAGTDNPSANVTIRSNHLDIGENSATQSIFIRNEVVDRGSAGSEMFYQNFKIEDNVIVNGHAHGITVGETDGLTIKNNTVLHADGNTPDGQDPKVEIPRISVSSESQNVSIQNNATSDILGHEGQADWSVQNNILVQDQDPYEAGYYKDVFVTSSLSLIGGVHHFRAVEGGALDTGNVGAGATHEAPQAIGLSAHFDVQQSSGNVALHHFDASYSTLNGQSLPANAEYLWTFADGTTLSGASATHAFSKGGEHDVTLKISLPDGQNSSQKLKVSVSDSTLVSYSANTDSLVYGDADSIQFSGNIAQNTTGIQLGEASSHSVIDRSQIRSMLNTDELRISMTLDADSANSAGEVMRLHGSFIISVTKSGELLVRLPREDGSMVRLTTQNANLQDMNAHDVDIILKDGVVQISIDGEAFSSSPLTGFLASSGNHDLTFGNQFTGNNFSGNITEFEIVVNESHFTGASEQNAAPPQQAVVESVLDVEVPDTDTAEQVVDAENTQNVAQETDSSSPDSSVEETEIPVAQPSQTPPITEIVAPVNAPDAVISPKPPHNEDNLIELTGNGVSSEIARNQVDHITGKVAFTLSFSISSASNESFGEVARLHQSFAVTVMEDGELNVRLFDEMGNRIWLTTDGAKINDTNVHSVVLEYSDGIVDISIDGEVLASTTMSSPLADLGRHNLTFGNLWTENNFEGFVSQFTIDTPTPVETAVDATAIQQSVVEDGVDEEQTSVQSQSVAASAAPENMNGILGESEFSISMTLTANSTESFGEVARLHQSLVTGVDQAGEVYVLLFSDAGESINLTTNGANVTDMNAHDVRISLSDGLVSIDVDGVTRASTEMSGTLVDVGSYDPTFGNSAGKVNFDGVMSGFNVEVPAPSVAPSVDALQQNITDFATELGNSSVDVLETANGFESNDMHLTETLSLDSDGLPIVGSPDRFETNLALTSDGYFE